MTIRSAQGTALRPITAPDGTACRLLRRQRHAQERGWHGARSTTSRRPSSRSWPAGSAQRRRLNRVRRKAKTAQSSQARRPQGQVPAQRRPSGSAERDKAKQGRKGQKPYPAEVDEGVMNPLISCTFRSLTRCRAPRRRGRASCYALRYPLPGTEEFGAFRAVGRYRRS